MDTRHIQNILVTRTDRIGDVILSTPVFEAIKKKFPHAHLVCMVQPHAAHVVKGNPWIDEVIFYDKRGKHRGWLATFIFAMKLRKKHFDLAVHLLPTNRVHVISFLARIPMRLGYRRKNHYLLTHSIEDSRWQGAKHDAEYNFDLLKPLGISPPRHFVLHFPLDENERPKLESLKKELGLPPKTPYFVINPSASCPSKVWSPERFARVANGLTKDYNLTCALIGAQTDTHHSRKVADLMDMKPVDFTGRLTLGMLGWLLKDARILISNDTAPVHIAASLDVPVISIFGRSQPGLSPARWRPLGKYSSYLHKPQGCIECLAHKCRVSFRCLDNITVDDVIGEVKKYAPHIGS